MSPPPFNRNIHSLHCRQYSPLLWHWQIHNRYFRWSQYSVWHHRPPNPTLPPKHQFCNIWHYSFLASVLSHESRILSSSHEPSALHRVPGSVLGPLLFTAYMSPIAGIAHLHNIDQQQYAILTPCTFGSVKTVWRLIPTSLKQSYLARANEPTATPILPQSTSLAVRSLSSTLQKISASHST